MNAHIFSFAECGHRISKRVDGHNSDLWNNNELRYTYKSRTVVSENCTKMLQ